MRRLILSLTASITGVALTLAGLGIDAWLHARDATLAGREGVFTLTNPGHALLAAGVALMCGGTFVALHAAWELARPRGVLGRPALRHLSLGASALASAGAVAFALSMAGSGHAHPGGGSLAVHEHVHDDMAAPPAPMELAATAPVADSEMPPAMPHQHATEMEMPTTEGPAPLSSHEHPAPPPMTDAAPQPASHTHDLTDAGVTAEQVACGRDLLDRTREATRRFEDYDVAVAEGYAQNKPDGNHYRNDAYVADGLVMDLGRPETLIYWTGPDGQRVLLGVMFRAARGQPGPTPCGPVTHWHTHTLCVDPATRRQADPSMDACPDGYVLRESGEMMHVWFVGRKGGLANGVSPQALANASAKAAP